MSKIRRIDFSPDEWLAGTRELTPEERGLYWDACALMYSRGGPIKDDEHWLAKAMAVNPRTWRKVRARLLELGKLRLLEDGYLTNGRTERELGHAGKRIDQARDAAAESARKRRMRAERDANAGPMEGESTSNAGPIEGQNGPDLSNSNDLGGAPAPRVARANHQPSTINHHKEDSLTQGRAQKLPPNWQPSEATLAEARKLRPDIQPARLNLEVQGFIARQRADNHHSHDWERSCLAWLLKTRITTNPEPYSNGTQRNHQSRGSRNFRTRAAAIAALSGVGSEGSAAGGGGGRAQAGGLATSDDDADEGTT